MAPQDPQQPQAPSPVAPQMEPQQVGVPPQPTMPLQPPVDAGAVPAKKRIPLWLKIVGIVVIVFAVVIVIAVVVTTTATKAPQKISDQFINDVQAGDISAAYALTSTAFQQATTQDQLDSAVQQVSSALQGQEKVTGRAIEKSAGGSEAAALVYTVKNATGTEYAKVELQKSGSTWQVANFEADSKPLDTTIK